MEPISLFEGATKVRDFFSGSGVYVVFTRVNRVTSEGYVGKSGICVFVRIEGAERGVKRTKELQSKG
jgi:hypothetical protein